MASSESVTVRTPILALPLLLYLYLIEVLSLIPRNVKDEPYNSTRSSQPGREPEVERDTVDDDSTTSSDSESLDTASVDEPEGLYIQNASYLLI